MEKILNKDLLINSLQVSKLKDIPQGNFNPGIYFLVKNITDNNIAIEVRPAGQSEFVSTVLYPGWNPELISEVKNVTANQLQYGW